MPLIDGFFSKAQANHIVRICLLPLWNRADRYIFALWFLHFFFFRFPRLISAVGDWMSAILPHMV